MMHHVLVHNNRPMVVLGMDHLSKVKLRRGQPVRVNLREIDTHDICDALPDIDIVVFFVEESTEASTYEAMRGMEVDDD